MAAKIRILVIRLHGYTVRRLGGEKVKEIGNREAVVCLFFLEGSSKKHFST